MYTNTGHLPKIIELSKRLRDAETQVQNLIEEIMLLEDRLQECGADLDELPL